MKIQFKLCFALLFFPIIVFAKNIDLGKYTKQKEIKKAYIVNSDAGISVKNSYGNVYVTTWDEDKIELNIVIKVSGDNEKWVLMKIDEINVDVEALKSMVTAETTFGSALNRNNSKNNSFEINYTIKIPKNGSVKIKNNYGSIITTDLFSSTNLSCDYGKLTLGRLNGNSNIISFDYCTKSSIEYLKTGTISANYSSFTLSDFTNLIINSDYTDCVLSNGKNLKYNCNYTKLNIGTVFNLEGDGDYLNIKANQISNALQINTEYSKIVVAEIDEKTKSINIDAEYTAIELAYHPNFAFNFDINLRYANLKYNSDFEFNSKQEKSFSKIYEGYHKKSGVNKVSIRSDYGNVSLLQR
jgi:hypothetical protein